VQLGNLNLDNPFILAPLAGYTDLAFRILCREYGADLCFSEMISCHGLVYQQQNTLEMIRTLAEERPVAMQLFGSEPEIMGEAAAILTTSPIDLIDINMGCPVKKVTKKGAGSALMKDPALAGRIIRAVRDKAKVPVSVKIRMGWTHQSINACEFAKMAEDNGAELITIHARTWSDGFSGTADWGMIREVKKSVAVPVIGNGDIKSYADGRRMIRETGCDGVMIGRAALGTPWIFSEKAQANPSLSYRIAALSRHLELIAQFFPADKILAKVKNQAGKYFKGVNGGSVIRKKIYDAQSFTQLQNLLADLY